MLKLYTLQYVSINGTLLTEQFESQIARSSNSQAVTTVARGYAGESPGAATVEIDVTNAVPADGFELDAGDNIEGLIPVDVGLIAAGKQLVVKAFIISDSFSHSVNAESKYSFKMRGPFATRQ